MFRQKDAQLYSVDGVLLASFWKSVVWPWLRPCPPSTTSYIKNPKNELSYSNQALLDQRRWTIPSWADQGRNFCVIIKHADSHEQQLQWEGWKEAKRVRWASGLPFESWTVMAWTEVTAIITFLFFASWRGFSLPACFLSSLKGLLSVPASS